jgi:hypothetical protein
MRDYHPLQSYPNRHISEFASCFPNILLILNLISIDIEPREIHRKSPHERRLVSPAPPLTPTPTHLPSTQPMCVTGTGVQSLNIAGPGGIPTGFIANLTASVREETILDVSILDASRGLKF